MSDFNPLIGDQSPVDDGLGAAEGATDDGQSIDQAVAEDREYLDLDQFGNAYARVKVDGQEIEVPLSEALQGYSRTQDYTRKTQELAQQRQQAQEALAIKQALDADPETAMLILSRRYGIQVPTQTPPVPVERDWEQPSYDDGDDNPYMDPAERRIMQLEARQRQIDEDLARRQAREVIGTQVNALKSRYQASEEDVQQVIQVAMANRMGPESFDMIYKGIAFDRAQQARAQLQQQRQTQEQQRRQAAQNAQQLVGSGGSANGAGGPLPGAEAERKMSLNEAFEAAWEQHAGA